MACVALLVTLLILCSQVIIELSSLACVVLLVTLLILCSQVIIELSSLVCVALLLSSASELRLCALCILACVGAPWLLE